MRIVLLGPPGAGKGTQAAKLAEGRGLPHISTGDVFRAAAETKTPMGLQASRYMQAGELVPDSVVIGVVTQRLQQDDCREGFVLDGFPRTLPQAEALDAALAHMGTALDAVVNINTPDDVCVRRLSGRRVCPQCKANYHVEWMPPKTAGKCDRCGAELVQRDDDRPDSIRERLRVYHEQTAPLIGYYSGVGVLVDLAGDQDVDALAGCVRAKLEEIAPSRSRERNATG